MQTIDRMQALVERLAIVATERYSTQNLELAVSIQAEVIERWKEYRNQDPTPRQKQRLTDLNQRASRLVSLIRDKAPASMFEVSGESLDQRIVNAERAKDAASKNADVALREWFAATGKSWVFEDGGMPDHNPDSFVSFNAAELIDSGNLVPAVGPGMYLANCEGQSVATLQQTAKAAVQAKARLDLAERNEQQLSAEVQRLKQAAALMTT